MKKNTILSAVSLLIAALLIMLVPTEAEGAVYDDTVRLHIIANSDSEEDQNIKLRLRDALLENYGTELAKYDSPTDAKEEITALISEIEDFCKEEISDMGYDYPVTATFDKEWYDTRKYENFTLPKGVYSSLRIFIGEGGGQNWWCVMYPPMCLDLCTESAPQDDAVKKYTDEEYTLISGGRYNVKFKILELFSGAFS